MLYKRLDDLEQFIAKKLRSFNNSMDSKKINHQDEKQTNQNDEQINQNESAQTRLTTSAIAMASSSAHSSSEGSNYSPDPVEYGPYRDNDAESLVSKKTATTQNDFSDDENHSSPMLNNKIHTNNNNQDEDGDDDDDDDDDLEVDQDEGGHENWYGDFQPNENNQSNSSDENSSYNIESTTNHQENQQNSSPIANTLITDEEPVGSSAYSRLTRTFRSYLNASNSVPIQNSQSSNENILNDLNSNINLSLTSMSKSEISKTNLHNQENNFKRFESKTILFDKILNGVDKLFEISETNIIKSNNKLNKKSLSRIVNLFQAHENYYTTMIFPISDNFKIDEQNETINLINNKRMKHSYNEDVDGKQISNFSHDDDEISIYINNEKDLLIDSLFNLQTDSSLLCNKNSTTSSMANDKNDLSDTDCKKSIKKIKPSLNEFHLCALCSHCLYDPITLVCGCSFCKNCLNEYNSISGVSKETDLPAKGKHLINSHKRKHNNGTLNEISMYKCYNCSSVHDHNSIDYLKQNVTLSKIVDKLWQNNVNVRKLRNDLRRYVCFVIENQPENVNFNKFELMFKKAFDLDPSNHLLLADLFILTYFDECNQKCLKYAQSVYDLRPNWPFSYFMKAIYYQKIGDLNQFKNNLIECLRLEPNIEQIRLKLYHLISKLNNENVSNNSLNQIINNIQINNDYLNSNETNSLNDSNESKKTQNLITDNKNYNQDKKTHSELNFDNSKYIIVNSHLVKPVELECSLCLRLLYNPVTTPCGHSFCASCLDRSLDHHDRCPLCKHSLADYLAERRQNVTLFLDELIKRFYVHEYEDRKKQSQEELKDLIGDENEVPVFVCTLGLPFVPCPLHIYEPRYRLMLRRAIETGSKQFGMCMYTEKTPHRYTEYGCMLDIKSCQFTRDGRAIVSTVGSRRFKVIHSATKDGYNVAKIEWVKDIKVESEFDKNELQQLHDEVYRLAQTWYNFLPEIQRNRIFGIYGINELPEPENDIQTENGPIWHWILLSILPLESDFQYKFLTKTSLKERLIQMRKIILILLAPLRRMFMSNQNSSTDSSPSTNLTPSSSIIIEASNSDSGTVTNSDNSNQNSANI